MKSTVSDVLVSGGSVAIVLVAIVYGGPPAASICVLLFCVGWLRSRERGSEFRHNLVTAVWYPMLTGLAFRAAIDIGGVRIGSPTFLVLAFPAALLALGLNVFAVALGHRLLFGRPVARTFLAIIGPVLAAELFSAVLTVIAVLVTIKLRLLGLIVLGVFLAILQYLLAELITSRHRHERLSHDGHHRRAHRPGQPPAVPRAHRAPDRRPGAGSAVCGAAHGPRPLQGGQRHARAHLRRPAAARARTAAGRRPPGTPSSSPGSAATSSGSSSARHATRVGDVERDRRGCWNAQRAVHDRRALTSRSAPASASPASRTTARTRHALLRCADVAMYAAKEAQTGVKFYTAEQNQHTKRRLSVLSDIRARARRATRSSSTIQPIVDLEDRLVSGAEGLVRWEHPEHGLIPPGAFVQSVEQTRAHRPAHTPRARALHRRSARSGGATAVRCRSRSTSRFATCWTAICPRDRAPARHLPACRPRTAARDHRVA